MSEKLVPKEKDPHSLWYLFKRMAKFTIDLFIGPENEHKKDDIK